LRALGVSIAASLPPTMNAARSQTASAVAMSWVVRKTVRPSAHDRAHVLGVDGVKAGGWFIPGTGSRVGGAWPGRGSAASACPWTATRQAGRTPPGARHVPAAARVLGRATVQAGVRGEVLEDGQARRDDRRRARGRPRRPRVARGGRRARGVAPLGAAGRGLRRDAARPRPAHGRRGRPARIRPGQVRGTP
jgi:hypothetical protein